MRDRLCGRVPVADELLAAAGGEESFCRRVVGKVVQDLEVDRRASRRAPLTLVGPTFVNLMPGASVVGLGYAVVVDARPIYPVEGNLERGFVYVCMCFEPLAAGEAATDTSPSPAWRWP